MPRDATAPRPLIREAARVPKTCSWRPPGRMQRPGGVSPCRRPPTCLRLQLRRHRHGLGCGCCHGGCGGCLYRCCCCTRGCSMGSMSGRLLLLCAAPASRDGRHSLHRGQVAQVAARVTCEGSQGSNSAVSGLSIRATRMAEAWVADALPGSCAMSLGCFRSEDASLERARAIRGSARGRGPGCERNVPSRGRAHPSCVLRQQRRVKELAVHWTRKLEILFPGPSAHLSPRSNGGKF